MGWTKLEDDVFCFDDEIGRWTIKPYGDTTWVNLWVEVPASESLGAPKTHRRRLPATASTMTVGFFASAGEAKIAYAILTNAPYLDLKGKDAVLSELSYIRKPFAEEAAAALVWQDLATRPTTKYENAPDTFHWYSMSDSELELVLDVGQRAGTGNRRDRPGHHAFVLGGRQRPRDDHHDDGT